MDGSEISSGQGKGEAQVFGGNQAIGLLRQYDMNRMKYGQKTLADMTKKSESIDVNGVRPGDVADLTKEAASAKDSYTTAMSKGTQQERAQALYEFNNKMATVKGHVSQSKFAVNQYLTGQKQLSTMDQNDLDGSQADHLSRILTTPLNDPGMAEVIDPSYLAKMPHFNKDNKIKFLQNSYGNQTTETRSELVNGKPGQVMHTYKDPNEGAMFDDLNQENATNKSYQIQESRMGAALTPEGRAQLSAAYPGRNLKSDADFGRAAMVHTALGGLQGEATKKKQDSKPTAVISINSGQAPTPDNGQSQPNVNLPGTTTDPVTGQDKPYTQNIKNFLSHPRKIIGIVPQGGLDLKTNKVIDNDLIKNATSYGSGTKLLYKDGTIVNVYGKDGKTIIKKHDISGTAVDPKDEDAILKDPNRRSKVEAVTGDLISYDSDTAGQPDNQIFSKSGNLPLQDYESKKKQLANSAIRTSNDATLAANKASAKKDGGRSTQIIKTVNASNAAPASSAPQKPPKAKALTGKALKDSIASTFPKF